MIFRRAARASTSSPFSARRPAPVSAAATATAAARSTCPMPCSISTISSMLERSRPASKRATETMTAAATSPMLSRFLVIFSSAERSHRLPAPTRAEPLRAASCSAATRRRARPGELRALHDSYSHDLRIMLHKDRVSRSLRSLAFVLVALSFSSGRSLVAEGGWINDGTDAAPRLSIEQSMWAMTGLPLGGQEWSLEEKVAKIAEAGFDGIMVFLPSNEAEEARYSDLAKRHGLAITLHCAPSSTEDVERAIASAKRLGARGIVAMIRPAFVTYGEGEAKIRAMSAACDEAKIPFYV